MSLRGAAVKQSERRPLEHRARKVIAAQRHQTNAAQKGINMTFLRVRCSLFASLSTDDCNKEKQTWNFRFVFQSILRQGMKFLTTKLANKVIPKK